MNLTVVMQQLVGGMGASLLIFVLTLLFSMPLGLAVAFGRMSKFKPLQAIIKFFIAILRGTPLMLQLLVVFFGPYYMFGLTLPRSYRFIAVIIGFAINYAAYFAEIYRSGIESIPKGQYEAASVLGYNKQQTFFKIIFPKHIWIVITASLPVNVSGICNLCHGSIVGLSILILQRCNAIGDGILNGGQNTAVIRALLCQPTGKLLYSGSPLLQFTTETGNLGGKIILKIFHTNICVIL